jgi:hypothetical protein
MDERLADDPISEEMAIPIPSHSCSLLIFCPVVTSGVCIEHPNPSVYEMVEQ